MTSATRPGRDPLGVAIAGLVVAAVYAAGACPTIYVGDSGELVTAVHVLGIPHPTGYPLYVLLGKLWTLAVPLGSVAYRMSLFSAAAGAGAAAALFATVRRLGAGRIAAGTAVGLAAFGPSTWGEATVQRVYTLNVLFVALATWCLVRWTEERRDGWLVALAFVCGLGATNHTFMLVYAVATALSVMAIAPATVRRGRLVCGAAGAMAIGLLPYLYLPLRSRMDPPLDWGNPETLGAFVNVLRRADFWGRAWIEGPRDLGPIVWDWARSVPVEIGWGGVGLAAVGLGVLVRTRRRLWVLPLLVMLGNVTAVALHGSRSDIFIWHRYYMPSYWMAALLAGLGTGAVVAALPRLLRAAPLLLVVAALASGWGRFDRSRYRIADAFSRAVLDSVPPGAHLIATDDNVLFVLLYLRFVEGLRPDVDLVLQGIGEADLPPLHFDPDVDPVFFTHYPNWHLPALDVVPVGLVYRVVRAGTPIPAVAPPLETLPGETDPAVPKDYLTHNLIGHLHFMLGVTAERRDWPRAKREFALAAAAAPANDVLFYNLGLVFERNGLWDEAARMYARSNAINPRHIAGSRARASDRLAGLASERRRVERLEAVLARDPKVAVNPPGSRAWHAALAALLAARGETAAARGHELAAAGTS
jgi:tetratricopeptide (TPR) repeat protein